MKLSEFKIDPNRKEDGAWVDIPQLPGVKFKVKGIGNREWNKVAEREAIHIPFSERKGGEIPSERQETITNTCILEAGLLDWSGIVDDDGEAVPYSAEVASKLISDPAYERFRDAVLSACHRVVEIEDDHQKEAEKN